MAEVDPKRLDSSVGRFELVSGFLLTFARDGDRTTVQATFDAYPESPTRFFLKVVDAEFSFVTEGDKVTGMIYRQGGRETTAKRLDD